MFFDLKDYDGSYLVERTEKGIRVGETEHELDGEKVMDRGMHIFSVCFKTSGMCLGPDYVAWKDGTADFKDWSKGGDYDPFSLRIDGEVYELEGADRSWPKPKLFKDGELKGYIQYSYDMESGSVLREVEWVERRTYGSAPPL